MSFEWVTVTWGTIAISAAVLAGIMAGVKNRDYSFWMGWSFVIPPFVFFLFFLPRLTGPRPQRPKTDHDPYD